MRQEKKSADSPEWEFFKQESSKDQAVCKLCGKVVPTKGRSTSCMVNHLRFRHENEYGSKSNMYRRPKSCPVLHAPQKSSTRSGSNLKENMKTPAQCVKYCQTSCKWKALTEAVTYCIVKDKLPLGKVEKPSFSAMLAKFDEKYVLPSRHYFSFKAIPTLCNCMREKLKSEISSIFSLAMTCTVWSDCKLISYISFASHYIDSNWDLQMQKLDAELLPESYTSTDITNAILNLTDDWEIERETITSLTVSKCAEISAACVSMGLPHVPCLGHILNAAIANALKEHHVSRALAAARQLIAGFSFNEAKRKDLQDAQSQLGLPQHTLVTDNSSKWLSTYLMLERLIEQHPAISDVLSAAAGSSMIAVSEEDFETFYGIICALKPIVDIIRVLRSDKYLEMSSVLPMQTYLIETMHEKSSDSEITQIVKSSVLGFFKKKLKLLPQSLLLKATFMDPRFKNYVGDKTGEIQEMLSLEFSYVVERDTSLPNKKLSFQELLQSPRSRKDKSYNFCLKTPSPYEIAVAEMEKYCCLPLLAANADPLLWWKSKTNAGEFQLISKLAKKYLCCRATCSPSDQLFSAANTKREPILSKEKDSRITKSKLFTTRAKSRSFSSSSPSYQKTNYRNKQLLPRTVANNDLKSLKGTEWCSSTKIAPAKDPSSIILFPRSSDSLSNTHKSSSLTRQESKPSEQCRNEAANMKIGYRKRKPHLKHVHGKVTIQTKKLSLKNVTSRYCSLSNLSSTPTKSEIKTDTEKTDLSKATSKCSSNRRSKNNSKDSEQTSQKKTENKNLDDSNVTTKSGKKSNAHRAPSSGKVKLLKDYFSGANPCSKCGWENTNNPESVKPIHNLTEVEKQGVENIFGPDEGVKCRQETQIKSCTLKSSLNTTDGGDVSTDQSLCWKDEFYSDS